MFNRAAAQSPMATPFPFIYPPNLSVHDVTTHGLECAGRTAARPGPHPFSKGLRATHRRLPPSPPLPRGVGVLGPAHRWMHQRCCAVQTTSSSLPLRLRAAWVGHPPPRDTLSRPRDPDRRVGLAVRCPARRCSRPGKPLLCPWARVVLTNTPHLVSKREMTLSERRGYEVTWVKTIYPI